MVEILVPVFIWWLILQAMALAILPLAFHIFRQFPDGGYTFAKPLGLLLISYLFWLLVSFRFLSNTPVAIAAAILFTGLICYIYLPRPELRAFWKEKKSLIVVSELLFAVAFLLWAVVRAYNPEITATEKPMEISFLNATLRSEYFPPHDPWLSGYAISYYHFGYVMMALLTKLSGVTSGVGFNLGIGLLLALTVLAAFGLGYNLVATGMASVGREKRSMVYGVLAALFVAGMGNLEGILEMLHTRGLGSPEFWERVDVKNLASAPITGGWIPSDNWWWWRASRVIRDSFLGADMEVIDEFPFFSFLLGDMHPHLLALPFTLLALGLAYKLFINDGQPPRLDMAILWITVGGLGFLNSWDLPAYGLIIVAAYGLREYGKDGQLNRRWAIEVLGFGARLILGSLILYLPFWITFRSQFGGLAPQLLIKTRLHQYLIMFGLFIFVASGFLVALLPGVLRRLRSLLAMNPRPGNALAVIIATSMAVAVLFSILQLWLLAVLTLILGAGFLILADQTIAISSHPSSSNELAERSRSFTLLLFISAVLLSLSVEFVYIRDVFDTRMNTVFKFYYQAWVLFAVASAPALAYLWARISASRGWRKGVGVLWSAGLFLLLGASLVYPLAATYSKTNSFQGPPTLDGMTFLQRLYPEEYAAIRWLDGQVSGNEVVLEAAGGSYTFYGRVSAYTGLPTLLGWGGHELQWRGNYDEPGRREPLIDRLYTSSDPKELHRLFEEFNIQYVYVGFLEREKYGPDAESLERWGGLMEIAYQNLGVVILKRVSP